MGMFHIELTKLHILTHHKTLNLKTTAHQGNHAIISTPTTKNCYKTRLLHLNMLFLITFDL